MKYKVYTRTEKSRVLSHRINEDRYLFSEYSFMEDKKICLLIVCDGIGGLQDGEKAAESAVKGFSKAFFHKMLEFYVGNANLSVSYFADEIQETVKEAICCANKEVCDNADSFKQTGCTISVVCIIDDYAVIGNVGDSPIYFYRSETEEFQLVSKLHTQAELDVDAGLYKRYSMEYYENDHKIYNSLGRYLNLNKEDITCEIIGYLEEGDIFLVGSDGAFGRMREYEILELIEEYMEVKPSMILSQLFADARMDKDDDQTAILYMVKGEE